MPQNSLRKSKCKYIAQSKIQNSHINHKTNKKILISELYWKYVLLNLVPKVFDINSLSV